MDVILMGIRGSGKSTLARSLCAATGLAYADLDDHTARWLGHETAAEAWNSLGEVAFRAAEVRSLRRALDDATPIIALGGGTPTAPGAEPLLMSLKRAKPPRIVYLRAPADILSARLRASDRKQRPSLTGASPAEEVPVVLAQRDPLYLRLADEVLDVGTLGIEEATAKLLALLRG